MDCTHLASQLSSFFHCKCHSLLWNASHFVTRSRWCGTALLSKAGTKHALIMASKIANRKPRPSNPDPFVKGQSSSSSTQANPGLVSCKCKRILYFSISFTDTLVDFTPKLHEWPNWEIWPTKCSDLKLWWILKFIYFVFSNRWMDVWNLWVLLNIFLPTSPAQACKVLALGIFSPGKKQIHIVEVLNQAVQTGEAGKHCWMDGVLFLIQNLFHHNLQARK